MDIKIVGSLQKLITLCIFAFLSSPAALGQPLIGIEIEFFQSEGTELPELYTEDLSFLSSQAYTDAVVFSNGVQSWEIRYDHNVRQTYFSSIVKGLDINFAIRVRAADIFARQKNEITNLFNKYKKGTLKETTFLSKIEALFTSVGKNFKPTIHTNTDYRPIPAKVEFSFGGSYEYDGSLTAHELGQTPREYVSNPLYLGISESVMSSSERELYSLIEGIDKVGTVNHTAGVHVHIGLDSPYRFRSMNPFQYSSQGDEQNTSFNIKAITNVAYAKKLIKNLGYYLEALIFQDNDGSSLLDFFHSFAKEERRTLIHTKPTSIEKIESMIGQCNKLLGINDYDQFLNEFSTLLEMQEIRQYSVNIYSMLRMGTLELRMFDGTLDKNTIASILNGIKKLHQTAIKISKECSVNLKKDGLLVENF